MPTAQRVLEIIFYEGVPSKIICPVLKFLLSNDNRCQKKSFKSIYTPKHRNWTKKQPSVTLNRQNFLCYKLFLLSQHVVHYSVSLCYQFFKYFFHFCLFFIFALFFPIFSYVFCLVFAYLSDSEAIQGLEI